MGVRDERIGFVLYGGEEERADEQLCVIKGNYVQSGLASAVTMLENTHWFQAGALRKDPPGCQLKIKYLPQNIETS